MDYAKCQIFTPIEIVKLMLDRIGYTKNVFGKKVIDNACGDGRFLTEILKRFIKDGNLKKSSKEVIVSYIENCISGYEIDECKYNDCIANLNKVADEYGLKSIKWNVHCADGLNITCDESFDYVVGNPPYISYKDLDKDIREDAKKHFISCEKGKFDYSYAFIEKGLNLLKSKGKMIMISPSNMFKTVFGCKLREIIKPHILEIIDCGTDNIFDKVLTSPAITIYQKGYNKSTIKYQHSLKGEINIINKDKLGDKWAFVGYNKGDKLFGEYFKVSNCVATLSNKIFIHAINCKGEVEIDGVTLEDGILKDAKGPRSEKFGMKEKIIFPYRYVQNELKRISEEELRNNYPNVYSYLHRNKSKLEKTDKDKASQWYEFGRSQALTHLNQPKLMISSIITKRVIVYELLKDEIPYSGVYIIPKRDMTLKDAKEILQSQDFYMYLLSVGISVSGNSIRISSKDIENYKF